MSALSLIPSAIAASVVTCIFAVAANELAGKNLVGGPAHVTLIVSIVFALLAIIPSSIWQLSAGNVPFLGYVVCGLGAGAVLYVGNVLLGMTSQGLSLFGLSLIAGMGLAANLGAFAIRYLIAGLHC